MVIDGNLKDIEFVGTDEDGHKTFKILNNSNNLTTLTAINEIMFSNLKVSKQFTGNMAELKPATFELRIYKDEDGTAYDKQVSSINVTNEGETTSSTITPSNGVFTFSITPTELGKDKSITLTLPSDVYYEVKEVNPVSNSGYTTYCGTSANPTDKASSTDEINSNKKFKLSGDGSVSTIYFINEKKIDTPTGFRDNVNPFVVLALTGLASMVFLAYDFQKRRLFED